MFKALKKKIQHGKHHAGKAGSDKALDDGRHRSIFGNCGPRLSGAAALGPEIQLIPKQQTLQRGPTRVKPEVCEELLTAAAIYERLRQEDQANGRLIDAYYVYDREAYKAAPAGQDGRDPAFDVFASACVTPTSGRYVIFQLAAFFIEQLNSQLGTGSNSTDMIRAAMEIFKPNLSHYSFSETQQIRQLLASFFPRAGCTLAGTALREAIEREFRNNWNRLILALRILWAELPESIVPWDCFITFKRLEERDGYPTSAFFMLLKQVLPSHDYMCTTYAFLEILVTIVGRTDLLVEKTTQMDLIFTAGQVCFPSCKAVEEYKDANDEGNDDELILNKIYRNRGSALYHLFVAYLRSLADKGKIKDFYLLDNFDVHEYPPGPYRPMTQRALTLTVPRFIPESDMRNDFNQLIKFVAKAGSRIYSSQHAFSKLENSFLDKFEENPLKVVEGLFSKSSKRYLYKFDKHFSTNYFKTLNDRQGWNRALHELDPTNQYAVSTWIESCKQHGFSEFLSMLEDNMGGEGTLALGHPLLASLTEELSFNAKEEEEELAAVRLSKMGVSEWFISSWKYEMFLGKIYNTLVIKLTKRVGDCDWIVISTDDRVSTSAMLQNRPLPTPPTTNPSRSDSKEEVLPKPVKPYCPTVHSTYSDQSSIRMRPPPLDTATDPFDSPMISSPTSAHTRRRSVVSNGKINEGSVSSSKHLSETGDTSSTAGTGKLFITSESPISSSTPIDNRLYFKDKPRQPPAISNIVIPQPLPVSDPGRQEERLFTPTGGAFVLPRPHIPMKIQNPSMNSFPKSAADRHISMIREEEVEQVSSPSSVRGPRSVSEPPTVPSHLMQGVPAMVPEAASEDELDKPLIPPAKPVDFRCRELQLIAKMAPDLCKPLPMPKEPSSLMSPVSDASDKEEPAFPEPMQAAVNTLLSENGDLRKPGNRATVIVYPKYDSVPDEEEDEDDEFSEDDSAVDPAEQLPVGVTEKPPQETSAVAPHDGQSTSEWASDDAPSDGLDFSMPPNQGFAKPSPAANGMKTLSLPPEAPASTNDFLEDFIDGYNEHSMLPPASHNPPEAPADETLFERVKRYYEDSPFERVPTIRSATAPVAEDSGVDRHVALERSPTTPKPLTPGPLERPAVKRLSWSQESSVRSAERGALRRRQASWTYSMASTVPPDEDNGFFDSDASESPDDDGLHISRFKNALLKTKRSINRLNSNHKA
ncbi:AAR073Wp [Eremothecium gossypii ATCC 10895]|uniref:AAR073Wp n=1 Tax=Eremothecium gossypii (strain ATCC 10895 / CBS 109.51 / FGSC 9923 / NRRL Y-1056) TaxID=284811 RepID=Q75EK6_EREGS|nr:AAR073Wp [Eremothecium gossypii ATCC 10895]AAS50438.1 AAR073Wp [Eremothecium gossypii ATCC 10895]